MDHSFDSEAELVDALEDSIRELLPRATHSDRWIVLKELGGVAGRPDLIVAKLTAIDPRLMDAGEALRTRTGAAIFEAMLRDRTVSVASFTEKLGSHRDVVRNHINVLREAGVVSVSDAQASLAIVLSHSCLELWAFETKLTNKRRALYQARRYQQFADYSIIVMPAPLAMRASYLTTLKERGLGLASVDQTDGLEFVVPPTGRRPELTVRRIMALGAILDRLASGRSAKDVDRLSPIG